MDAWISPNVPSRFSDPTSSKLMPVERKKSKYHWPGSVCVEFRRDYLQKASCFLPEVGVSHKCQIITFKFQASRVKPLLGLISKSEIKSYNLANIRSVSEKFKNSCHKIRYFTNYSCCFFPPFKWIPSNIKRTLPVFMHPWSFSTAPASWPSCCRLRRLKRVPLTTPLSLGKRVKKKQSHGTRLSRAVAPARESCYWSETVRCLPHCINGKAAAPPVLELFGHTYICYPLSISWCFWSKKNKFWIKIEWFSDLPPWY